MFFREGIVVFNDGNGKVTISLGGKCTLGCKHCYTNTNSFVCQPEVTPLEAIAELSKYDENSFSTICISGDTDFLLKATKGIELLRLILNHYCKHSVMFTTRLIPDPDLVYQIVELGKKCLNRGQMLIPCISIVSYSYPNQIEIPSKVPCVNSGMRAPLARSFCTTCTEF